jgi:hypothetical protein
MTPHLAITGESTAVAEIDAWDRPQRWTDPATQTRASWRERVLVVRTTAYQAGLRQRRERAIARLTDDLMTLW